MGNYCHVWSKVLKISCWIRCALSRGYLTNLVKYSLRIVWLQPSCQLYLQCIQTHEVMRWSLERNVRSRPIFTPKPVEHPGVKGPGANGKKRRFSERISRDAPSSVQVELFINLWSPGRENKRLSQIIDRTVPGLYIWIHTHRIWFLLFLRFCDRHLKSKVDRK